MANAAKLLRESLDSNSRYENAINDDEKYMDDVRQDLRWWSG